MREKDKNAEKTRAEIILLMVLLFNYGLIIPPARESFILLQVSGAGMALIRTRCA